MKNKQRLNVTVSLSNSLVKILGIQTLKSIHIVSFDREMKNDNTLLAEFDAFDQIFYINFILGPRYI